MAPTSPLDHLSNPLVTVSQLQRLRDSDTEESISIRFAQTHLCQASGILLRLPQEVIATSIVLLQRYLLTHNSDAVSYPPRILAAAAIYLAAKISFTPLSPRSVINVFAYLTSSASPLWYINPHPTNPSDTTEKPDAQTYFVSEGLYSSTRLLLFSAESALLTTLGFSTHVFLPHSLALTYLQLLSSSSPSPDLATRVLAHLNTALLSPQLLYLTHQPNSLAVAAIYLAAKEEGVKLPDRSWWEVFDVDREDLGFLVLALASTRNFVEAEKVRYGDVGRGLDLG